MYRDLNNPETHDGTAIPINVGGPYHLRISVNGQKLWNEEIGKDDRVYVAITPRGETNE